MYINRHILPYLSRMKKQFRVLLVTGSRKVGKSTLLKENLLPVVVDEAQRAPDLFLQIKLFADKTKSKGQIIFPSCQKLPESSSARAALFASATSRCI